MPYAFTLKTLIPASSEDIYKAWMSSEGHSAMTGTISHVDPVVGGKFDAFDGYISGQTLELDPGRRIMQSWRTRNFTDGQEDSLIEVRLESREDSTILTLMHSKVPDEQTNYELVGWAENYFEPMKRRFKWLQFLATM